MLLLRYCYKCQSVDKNAKRKSIKLVLHDWYV